MLTEDVMKGADRRSSYGKRWVKVLLSCLLAGAVVTPAVAVAPRDGVAPGSPSATAKPSVYEFLVRNHVPIRAKLRVGKLSAVLRDRYKVRSVVKIIQPEKTPAMVRKGRTIKFDTSKAPSELELLRQNLLAGEVIPFHPSEKLGDLELFFSKTQSLKVQIGYDMFYIRIGNNDCTFRSPSLRRQLNRLLHR
jgi:hypothetical protein